MTIRGRACFLLLLLGVCNAQNCKDKETCRDCIQEPECTWCIAPKNISGVSQNTNCADRNENLQNWCEDENLVDPQTLYQVLKNDPLSSEGNIVQMKPQRVKLTLRKGETFKFNFEYQQTENFPVDLYYIMDLSNSMKDHKNKLGDLGDTLVKTMRNITKNFQLGFGSFVDKVDLPFTSTLEGKLQEPCAGCAAPYSFINHLSLSEDGNKFKQEVKKAQVSGNLDAPEGGFDALMQAMVCKEEIKWRENSRHLIVFSTDADFHIAGDGKLAGIVEPNDAKCHMKDGKYIADLIYDYPSISHINYIAKQKNFNIIFAIAKGKQDRIYKSYEKLQEHIENSGVGALDRKSENVVELIIENYKKIADIVRMTNNGSDSGIEIKYSSNCKDKDKIPNGCNNVHVGEKIVFTAEITAKHCLSNSPQIISIKRENSPGEIFLELDVICDCNCENYSIPNDKDHCFGHGSFECGICNCNTGRYGSNCECDNDSVVTNNTDSCRQENSTDICSNQGICKCGKCECNNKDKISGKYCECDKTSCIYGQGKICNGNGECVCGECKCNAGWEGSACECSSDKKSCTDPNNPSQLCSGKGECKCGECVCENPYNGIYCQDCPTCKGRCEELNPCVECRLFDKGKYDKVECDKNCDFIPTLVDKIDENNSEEDEKLCIGYDEEDCKFIFTYKYDSEKKLVVKAQKTKICNKVDILALVLGLIGSIVLAGLLLLAIWKIATTIHDKREYARFEEDQKKSKFDRGENPFYKPPQTEVKNPLYSNQ